MFDKEQFREEIEAQLRNVHRDKCVALAMRSIMRVLPLLAIRKNVKRFFIQLTGISILILVSAPTFAHIGHHEARKCFFSMGGNELRVTSHQFQNAYPHQKQSYCQVFPALGSTLILIESIRDGRHDKKISLQLLKLDSWIDWIFNPDNAFSSLKQTPLQNYSGYSTIQADIAQRGVYALAINLQIGSKEPIRRSFLFLAGIPVTKILVLFSGCILLLLVFMAVKKVVQNRLA